MKGELRSARLKHTIAAGFAIALVAGCVTPEPEVEPTEDPAPPIVAFVPPIPDFDFSTIIDPDHASHQLPHLHADAHGLDLVGHTAISSVVPPGVTGSITQIDVQGDHALVAGYQGDLAFAIVDISDPTSPTPVSSFLGGGNPRTARFSDDGAFVFYGCETPAFPLPRGTCTDHAAPAPGGADSGIVAVDVTDKANPTFVHFLPAGGAHNIFVAAIEGVDYIFTASTEIIRFDRNTGKLEKVAELPGVHDVTVARHPATGDLLLFTGTSELAIYDVDDPTAPELLYEAREDAEWVGWHDQVLVPGLVDGRAILLLGGEYFAGSDGGGRVFVLDVTDPTAPANVGEWAPPFAPGLPWTSYLYSMHEMAATTTGQVAIGWNHAGVWVFDVSTQERQAAPATLAAYQPHAMPEIVPSLGPSSPLWMLPRVWGAGWDARGYLIVPDMLSGVYVLEPAWGLHPTIESGQ